MSASPFAFYRGAAAIMAYDLARTPATGLNIQICGDCHLLNFGGFATTERKLIFDINDFDETHVTDYAARPVLEAWYDVVDLTEIIAYLRDKKTKMSSYPWQATWHRFPRSGGCC